MSFKMDISGVLKGLAEAEIKTRAAIGAYGDAAGKKLEATAKKEASWVDRTGDARKTIQGGYKWQGTKCVTYVAGNMNYSPYLEFANQKNYAILNPTVKKLTPEIIKGMQNLLK